MAEIKTEDKWRAESDLRVLMEAEEIKRDSKRLKAAREELSRKRKDLDGVQFETSQEDRRTDIRKRR